MQDDEELARARRRMVEGVRIRMDISDERVVEAMIKVERHKFVPERLRHVAYNDYPLDIGEGQTISAPHMVAIMAEKLDIAPGMNILEIGGGSGYHAAVVAELARPGHVFSIEIKPALAECARRNIECAGYSEFVTVITGDGTLGYSEKAPYDRIFIAAAAPDIPRPLVEQLREGGKMLAPVGSRMLQELTLLEKRDGKMRRYELGGCVFVPMIGEYGFKAWNGRPIFG